MLGVIDVHRLAYHGDTQDLRDVVPEQPIVVDAPQVAPGTDAVSRLLLGIMGLLPIVAAVMRGTVAF